MNQKEVLLAKAEIALRIPAAVSFVLALQKLAPDNIPGIAKSLRDKAGQNQVWGKSIVDLARLARDYPRLFQEAIKGNNKMKIKRRIKLNPDRIRNGYNTILPIAGFECELCVSAIGECPEAENSKSNILGCRIESEETDVYSFMPYFKAELYLPPVTKRELLQIIQSFGPYQWPDKRMFSFIIDGCYFGVDHNFDKKGESLNFLNWFLRGFLDQRKEYKWEDDLNSFCLIVRFSIDARELYCGEYKNEVPDFLRSRDIRLKIVLACLNEYFNLPIEPL